MYYGGDCRGVGGGILGRKGSRKVSKVESKMGEAAFVLGGFDVIMPLRSIS